MKLKLLFMILGSVLLASCGGGSDSPNTGSANITTTTTSNVSPDSLRMGVTAVGLKGDKTRVSVLVTVKSSAGSIQPVNVVELTAADSIHVMAYGVEKIAEKFMFPSGAFEYRTEFDSNTSNMPIEVWYETGTGARLDIGRVESLGSVMPYTSSYADKTVSVVFDSSNFPTNSFPSSSVESLKCQQGGNDYLFIPNIEDSVVDGAYVHSLDEVFAYELANNGVNISNCTFDLSISYYESGLVFNNNWLLWGDGTFESGSVLSGQKVELEFSEL